MKPLIARPLGITLLAILFLWIGCFGTLAFPFLLFTGGAYHAWMLLAGHHIGSRNVNVAAASALGIAWYAGYILYAFIGFGFWKLRRRALRTCIFILWLVLCVAVLVSLFLLRLSPLLVLSQGVLCAAVIGGMLWYLKRPAVRWAFEASEASRAGLPIPQQPSSIVRRPRMRVSIGVAVALAAFALFFVSLMSLVQKSFRSSLVYTQALQQARSSPCVTAQLGSALTQKGLISGSLSEGEHGSAELSMPVRGSKSAGVLRLSAASDANSWQFKELTVETGSGQISLVPEEPCK